MENDSIIAMGQPKGLKAVLVGALALSCFLWGVLVTSVPKAQQDAEILRYPAFCDYRLFMVPCMTDDMPYRPSKLSAYNACYPPIAYCIAGAIARDKGNGWEPSLREGVYLLSIMLSIFVGLVVIIRRFSPGWWFLTPLLLLSSGCVSPVLLGNPVGWAFSLVCVFLSWHGSEARVKRLAAAVALGLATALKITPCLFGVLYLVRAPMKPRLWPWKDIAIAATSAIIFTFVPFAVFGGFESIPLWFANARANASHFGLADPIWGFVGFVNALVRSEDIPSLGPYCLVATRFFACLLVISSVWTKGIYRKLLFLGAAMAFLTYHNYGGAYLVPAFVAWMGKTSEEMSNTPRIIVLLEASAWFLILTPLQFPNPVCPGTLNRVLQNESLFLLLIVAFAGLLLFDRAGKERIA